MSASNGWKLLKEHKTARAFATCAGAFTLNEVRHSMEDGTPLEWATHWRNDDTGGHFWGHYFRTLGEAEADYAARVLDWETKYGKAVLA